MKKKRKDGIGWHALGIVIVAVWVIFVGFLVRKVHFTYTDGEQETMDAMVPLESGRREWKEIFLKDRKIGYAVNEIRPSADGYMVQEEMFLKMNLMGLASGVHTVVFGDVDKSFRIRKFRFRMLSGAVSFEASGRMEGDGLVVETGMEGERRTQRIPMEQAPLMAVSLAHVFAKRELSVGEVFRFPIFDPASMSRKDTEIRVVARESVRIRGISYDAVRLEAELWGNTMTFWVDEEGVTLKETGFMGLTAVRSSAATAPENIQGSGDIDFYEISSITPDRDIPRPRKVSFLRVRLDGVEDVKIDREVWDRGRQRISDDVMEIEMERPPFASTYERPMDPVEETFDGLLSPEFNIESDHPEIIRQAEAVAGSERDPLQAARKVREWVWETLEKRPVVSVPSALDVLRSRVGDCNEHATLTAALLRALGIPARIVVGLVYTRGQFFYHAWNEVYVGDWISMDTTLNQMPADATHIQLLEGNLDKQVDVMGLIGRLQVKVMDYRHD